MSTYMQMLRGATIAVLAIVVIGAVPAHAIQCGDTITTDTTLTADLGPCPGYALTAQGQGGGNFTLDLNGHSIIGSGGGTGLILAAVQGVSVKGPGQITNFETAIYATGGGGGLIYDLVLRQNVFGIVMARWGGMRIFGNVVIGKTNSLDGNGVRSTASSRDIFVYQNTITAHSGPAVSVSESAIVIDENLITGNQRGVVVASLDRSCFAIRGNRIISNRGDGIEGGGIIDSLDVTADVIGVGCSSAANIIEDNSISWNGGSGILIQGGGHPGVVVQDNMVSSNGIYGISVIMGSTGSTQVVGNRVVRNNGTDLFWNGVNTNSCWSQNVFGTSSPQTLPPCL